ncbi:hypothetical protein VTN49DRAFT_3981 [Thermomyces lanuginosus]|uniref:uncharacterized protein n=1 Tax=Thermomyces lanuginosus TaxID=5541 RepID=UPI0037438361
MFSEYASRFLAQSQSRLTARPEENNGDRYRRYNQAGGGGGRLSSRSHLNRIGNPYQQTGSHLSQFPFASRSLAQPAPLFFSATDEFREEDDEQEHEREIADYYALQKSRRHFGNSQTEGSSELDDDDRTSEGSRSHYYPWGTDRKNGIKSSWRDERVATSKYGGDIPTIAEPAAEDEDGDSAAKGKMVDVGLDDTLRSDSLDSRDESADDAPIQQFRKKPDRSIYDSYLGFPPQETDREALLDESRRDSTDSVPPSMKQPEPETPMHDVFWGHLFLLSLASLFATAFLVYLHTAPPSEGKWRWGDTIYIAIQKSYFLLGIYTLVSIFVSLLWLALLRSYIRVLVMGIVVAVPTILYAFSLYPFISSFKGSWHGASVQDKVMRWGSIVPFVTATLWIYAVFQNRHATSKAIRILEFACRILAANPALVGLGLLALGALVSWTWLWMLMFTRIFLGGHVSSSGRSFILDVSSWWLGVYFILVYLWSVGVISGLQRAVSAATVSQWYFHRLAVPAPTSLQVVRAALIHAGTTLFGTVCLSSLLALLLRLPLLVLPRRLTSIITLCMYWLVPTPVAALVNPLAVTYAAIHSTPLHRAARSVAEISSLATLNTPLHHQYLRSPSSLNHSNRSHGPLVPYRLAKLILHACRVAMSLALGFGGWVTTARTLDVSSGTIRGSLYAYVVGLLSGCIGWTVLGAMEGVLACVVDAAIVCWASEVGNSGREARYCREAEWLFNEGAVREY